MNTILLDLPNFLACILLITFSYKLRLIPFWIAIILGAQSILPYFLNDVLFPDRYMPDQFRYFNMVHSLRDFLYTEITEIPGTVYYASWMLSFIPIPFVETIKSLGFFNRFIFIVIFIWIYNKNFLRGLPLYFVLFMPSLMLYTSLALRDTLILCFMLISIVCFLEKRYFLITLFIIPLYLIKPQNAYFMVLLFAYFTINNPQIKIYKYRYLVYLIGFYLLLPQINLVIDFLDLQRFNLYKENKGIIENYIPIETFIDLIVLSLTAAPYFLLKPFVWEARNLFQFLQSIENMIVLLLLLIMTWRAMKINMRITSKWLVYFLIVIAINGLVVFNFGTAARYRFTFIVIYVIGLHYELYRFYISQVEYHFLRKIVNKESSELTKFGDFT